MHNTYPGVNTSMLKPEKYPMEDTTGGDSANVLYDQTKLLQLQPSGQMQLQNIAVSFLSSHLSQVSLQILFAEYRKIWVQEINQ